jgi:5-methylcytosine-specific restriction endonuclease McrA
MTRQEFSVAIQKAASKRANGHCEQCGLPFAGRRPELHHVKAAFYEGPPTLENAALLCPPCHRIETSKAAPRMAKTRRQEKAEAGIKAKGRGFRGWRKMNGDVVWKDSRHD